MAVAPHICAMNCSSDARHSRLNRLRSVNSTVQLVLWERCSSTFSRMLDSSASICSSVKLPSRSQYSDLRASS